MQTTKVKNINTQKKNNTKDKLSKRKNSIKTVGILKIPTDLGYLEKLENRG